MRLWRVSQGGSLVSKSRPTSDHRNLKRQLQGLGDKLRSLEAGYRARVQATVAAICEIGLEYEADCELWASFCRDKIWVNIKRRPSPDKPDRAVRFAFRLACGLDSAGTKSASFYHLAVAKLLEQGVAPTDLACAIQNGGGLKALSKKGTKGNPPVAADKAASRMRSKPPPLQPKTEREKTGRGETSASAQLALFGAVEQSLPSLAADALQQSDVRVSVLKRDGNAMHVIFHSIKAS